MLPAVPLGDGDDEAKVGFDQLLLGLHVVAFDALGQSDLLRAGQQRHLADLGEIGADGVAALRLDRQIELGSGGLFGFGGGAVDRRVAFDDVDAELVERDDRSSICSAVRSTSCSVVTMRRFPGSPCPLALLYQTAATGPVA